MLSAQPLAHHPLCAMFLTLCKRDSPWEEGTHSWADFNFPFKYYYNSSNAAASVMASQMSPGSDSPFR